MHLKTGVKSFLRRFHAHEKSRPDIFIFTLPRSGSTLLAEVLNVDAEVKMVSEPFALHNDNRQILEGYFDPNFLAERYADLNPEELIEICRYLRDLSEGETWNSFYWTDFFSGHHSFRTKRTLFKTHKLTWYFDEIMQFFSGDYGIYLLRHPVSQSLSRLKLGWTDYVEFFLNSKELQKMLSAESLKRIVEIKKNASDLDRMVISWCLENYVFLSAYKNKRISDRIFPVFYEDLVLTPEETLISLCEKIQIDFRSDMLEMMKIPSSGAIHSDKRTEKLIRNEDRKRLVGGWEKANQTMSKQRLSEILEIFGIEIYL